MKRTIKPTQGFTLVELLVVIAIIAVLATVAAPAIMGSLRKAKITRVSAVCRSVEVGINNFEQEYNYLPYGGAGNAPQQDEAVESDSDLIAVLAGVDDTNNPKEINFLDGIANPAGTNDSNYKDGLLIDKDAGTAVLYDAWGRDAGKTGTGVFHIVIDYDYDGVIDHPYDSSEEVTGKKALVYSYGPDRLISTGGIRNKDNKDNPSNFK